MNYPRTEMKIWRSNLIQVHASPVPAPEANEHGVTGVRQGTRRGAVVKRIHPPLEVTVRRTNIIGEEDKGNCEIADVCRLPGAQQDHGQEQHGVATHERLPYVKRQWQEMVLKDKLKGRVLQRQNS